MNAAQLCPANRTAMILRDFGRPVSDEIYRAYDHLIAVRLGMVLMVPVGAVSGALTSMTDLCPVPWLEATAVLGVEYDKAADLSLMKLVAQSHQILAERSPLSQFAKRVTDIFIGTDKEHAIALTDKNWRHAAFCMSEGGEPCRVFIGAAGVRLAFTPDFLEGVL